MKTITGSGKLFSFVLIIFTAVILVPYSINARSKSVKDTTDYSKNSGIAKIAHNDSDLLTVPKSSNKMKIKIGAKTFTATLNDNVTAKAFKALLPLTIKMDDLNDNEKKYDFSKIFPGKSVHPGTINTGDMMIWSGKTFVLFYKAFSTSYSYVNIGHIDDPSGLAAALGRGSVTITLEL